MNNRISTGMMFNQSVSLMLAKQAKMSHLEQQIATGRRLVTAKDDPVASGAAVGLDRTLASLERMELNAGNVQNRLGLQENALAQVGVGQADHYAAFDAGKGVDRRLDLGGIDVGPAGHDHVHPTVGQEQIAVFIDMAQVAQRFEIAARADVGPQIPIGRSLTSVRKEVDFPDRSSRTRIARIIEDVQGEARQDATDRPRFLQPVEPPDHRAAQGLRSRIDLPDGFGAHPVDPASLQPGRAGGGDVQVVHGGRAGGAERDEGSDRLQRSDRPQRRAFLLP